MAFLQAPIWARKMRVGNSLTFDDAQEKVPIFVNLYWCDIAGSESPPLFTAADKPERPPSKELRRIKSFMQGQKRPPMLSRRAASLMQRSFDDLSLDLGNQKNSPSFCCLCLFLSLWKENCSWESRVFFTPSFFWETRCRGKNAKIVNDGDNLFSSTTNVYLVLFFSVTSFSFCLLVFLVVRL